jgi:hypothetical protein
MASALNAGLGALVAALFWCCIGLALARRVLPAPLAWPLAPALGWAVHGALALPVFRLLAFSTASVVSLGLLVLAAAVALLIAGRDEAGRDGIAPVRPPVAVAIAAAVIALAPAAAILPKITPDGVALAAPIFDHAKVAIVEDMMRLGLPPGNPFFADPGAPRLAYYYLWHFSAAELALATGISGWEADVAVTWFTAFSSLLMLAGLAVWLARRTLAGFCALVLAIAGSARPILYALFDSNALEAVIRYGTGFGGWYYQSTWSPQNAAAAACAVITLLLLALSMRRLEPLPLVVMALAASAAFASSTWLGSVLPPAAIAAGLLLLLRTSASERATLVVRWAAAAMLALAVAAPLIVDQLASTAARDAATPIVASPFPVLGEYFVAPWRRLLDVPAFWLVQLPLELPATYLAGFASLWSLLRAGALDQERRHAVVALAVLACVSLVVSSMLASRIGDNNDLGWRAVLPGTMVLIVLAAVGITRWLADARLAAAAAFAALLLGLPEAATFIRGNVVGTLSRSGAVFAQSPAMWVAVRRHAAPDERVANNPLFLADLTPWPINLSWALMANRRSCYAGRELVLPFTTLSRPRIAEIDARFIRVFAGTGTPDDVRALAERYRCGLVVLTAEDGAWGNDPFPASPLYRLLESVDGRWRIYRVQPKGD